MILFKVSVLITAFQRPHLLKWNLFSLARQEIPFSYEIIVLNDGIADETETLCAVYQKRLNIKYVFTGQRNRQGEMKYRVPGFALNIGAKLSSGDVLIISCAEMFHLNETIAHLCKPVVIDPKFLATSIGMDDQDASFLDYVESNGGDFDYEDYLHNYPLLNTSLPFLMAVKRREFFAIGGYDEDFVGFAYDDNDLISRLSKNGCRLCLTQAQTIHLYHPAMMTTMFKARR
ncbi:glycosyltransferase family 2 protein [Syntrophomonas palmitatica]|uniref:glycosyltransferase family 2 protein n=1 Tax=Syntrophomonas palmitatica TaxID=402877 RepID=UPI0006D0C47A|nr:galactosyltransferase-related protein [Syntrophomonas palmitatica]